MPLISVKNQKQLNVQVVNFTASKAENLFLSSHSSAQKWTKIRPNIQSKINKNFSEEILKLSWCNDFILVLE